MSAREVVLARIRAALGTDPVVPVVPRAYRTRGEHPPGHPALLDLLTDRLVDYRATVTRTAPGELAATLAAELARIVPPGGRVVVPPDLPAHWGLTDATRDDGSADATALDGFAAVVTGCAAVAAETGTIALDGGPGQGRRALTLVPDRHLCVVHAGQVVQSVPELLARLARQRPVTLVSGPSATSDIELHRVEGVHGPRTLAVVLVRPA
ncbi:LUD domain-containing protein [Micromonospora sp. NPDC023956]|uniref:LutC/YkgG family protein n=1 Tax=Micromonospora sp. NPDC023956 TaxID=3155722 RepID=UPI0033E0B9A1